MTTILTESMVREPGVADVVTLLSAITLLALVGVLATREILEASEPGSQGRFANAVTPLKAGTLPLIAFFIIVLVVYVVDTAK